MCKNVQCLPRPVVTIIGGGLAGTVTGLWLQHRGVEARILERRPGPGTTLCGEGVSTRALRALQPVFDARPFVDRSFVGARWRFPGSTVWVHQTCHTMDRAAWIAAMAEAFEDRGGTIEYGTHADPDGLDGIVVGADGPGSKVRAWAGGEVSMCSGMQVRIETPQTTDRLEFMTDKRFSDEYAWWFPRSGGDNVGLLMRGDGRDEARLRSFVEHLGLEGATGRVQVYPIAFGGDRVSSPDGRVLLIGDAAGLTNPVTKGGIAAVVHAAPLLADAVARGRPRDYARSMRRHPLRDPAFGRALRRLRRWDDATLRRLLSGAPREIHAGGPTTDPRPVALRTAMRRPWMVPAMADLYRATVGSLRWSW